jgi:hypothetical protein
MEEEAKMEEEDGKNKIRGREKEGRRKKKNFHLSEVTLSLEIPI